MVMSSEKHLKLNTSFFLVKKAFAEKRMRLSYAKQSNCTYALTQRQEHKIMQCSRP